MNTLPTITCRFAAFLLLSVSACSSTTDDISTIPTGGTSTGPTGGTSTGGTTPQTGGFPATTGGVFSTGGTAPSTGGFASQGGTTGGFSTTGGQFGQGGSTGGNASTGGTFGQGGTLTGGASNGGTNAGGFSNGGTGGTTGGKGGGGARNTGGAASGGMGGGGKAGGGTGGGGKATGGASTGGSATGGTGGDPFGGASVCTSKTTWKSGNNQNMRPGEACIACHATNGAPDFTIAGTVFPTGHEPNDCNGKGGVTIVITDSKGTAHNITVNSVGNFNFTGSLPTPYTAKVTTTAGASRAMLAPQTSGDCNSCHTEKGANGAPGRIVVP
ncbi:MAG TPA: hypothetical protein VG937_16780 [Polyangiaceae bacterium]|nr:hypothetical protein [Polyangiaceae bacterium]